MVGLLLLSLHPRGSLDFTHHTRLAELHTWSESDKEQRIRTFTNKKAARLSIGGYSNFFQSAHENFNQNKFLVSKLEHHDSLQKIQGISKRTCQIFAISISKESVFYKTDHTFT